MMTDKKAPEEEKKEETAPQDEAEPVKFRHARAIANFTSRIFAEI